MIIRCLNYFHLSLAEADTRRYAEMLRMMPLVFSSLLIARRVTFVMSEITVVTLN